MNEDELRELRDALKDMGALALAKADQAAAMTDKELGDRLLHGQWSTVEVHEAGIRLIRGFNEREEEKRKNFLEGPGGEWFAT